MLSVEEKNFGDGHVCVHFRYLSALFSAISSHGEREGNQGHVEKGLLSSLGEKDDDDDYSCHYHKVR